MHIEPSGEYEVSVENVLNRKSPILDCCPWVTANDARMQGCKVSGNVLNSGNFTEIPLNSLWGNFVLYKRIGNAISKDIFRKFWLLWLASLQKVYPRFGWIVLDISQYLFRIQYINITNESLGCTILIHTILHEYVFIKYWLWKRQTQRYSLWVTMSNNYTLGSFFFATYKLCGCYRLLIVQIQDMVKVFTAFTSAWSWKSLCRL